MLGQKRSASLFSPQPTPEEKPVEHITVQRDGGEKEIPLYFGKDWPVGEGVPHSPEPPADAPNTETQAAPAVPDVPEPPEAPDSTEQRIIAADPSRGGRAHSLFFTPEDDTQEFSTVLKDVQEYISGKYSSLIADGVDKDGKCWPAIKTIAKELNLSRSTVKRALDDLCQAGLLTKETRWRKNGGLTSNLYRVT